MSKNNNHYRHKSLSNLFAQGQFEGCIRAIRTFLYEQEQEQCNAFIFHYKRCTMMQEYYILYKKNRFIKLFVYILCLLELEVIILTMNKQSIIVLSDNRTYG